MLALAQKAAATTGIERLAGFIGNLAAEFPEAKDNFDPDATIQLMNGLLGNPERILRGPEQMAAIRNQRAQQQQQMQKMQMQQHMADTASTGADAANTLAGTKVGQGQQSMLDKMLGAPSQ